MLTKGMTILIDAERLKPVRKSFIIELRTRNVTQAKRPTYFSILLHCLFLGGWTISCQT